MKRASGKTTYLLGSVLTGVLASQTVCLPVLAALGDDVSTVEADRAHMKGQLRITAAPGYTIHEIQTSPNGVVREFVSAAGKVFAVTWRGPAMPDLHQTLGTYYNDYLTAAETPHVGHRHLSIERPDIVVHSNGRMRAFFGQAYVPALLPAGFSVADLN